MTQTGPAVSPSVHLPPYAIRIERADDHDAIEALYEDAFGPGRFAKSAERLREGNAPFTAGCFVAEDEQGLTGVVRLWPVASSGDPILLLGPFAVAERRRRNGVGFRLIERAVMAAQEAGWGAILLVGDPGYYQRVGFAPLAEGQIVFPGPVDAKRILVRELVPGALAKVTGRLKVPSPGQAG
jgi:predicted N-acetyltransferase YhbS